MMRVYSGQVRV